MMHTILAIALFVIGLILIIKGGDLFVDAASWMAEVSGIPKFVVGATIVSVATTLPELMVSLFAAAGGKVDMAIGNAIGSVTANTGLILSLAVLFVPSIARRENFAFKGCLLVAVIAVLCLLCRDGALTVAESLILFLLLAIFLAENVLSGRKTAQNEEKTPFEKKNLLPNVVRFVVGAAAIAIGSQLLVNYGSELARMIGVSEKIISVTAIAIGTSLPELITAITSIRKKDITLSVGNILGANIIDTSLILPACAIASGGSLPVPSAMLNLDFPVCLAIAAVGVIPTLFTQKQQQWQSVLALGIYGAYLVLTCL